MAASILLHGALSVHVEPPPPGDTKTPFVPSATGTHDVLLQSW
jgi:hypothetical protein